MVTLLRECRAGLVTNMSLFNIMALYSMIQYTTSVIAQYFYSYPSDFQYLFWDIGCNLFFFLLVGRIGSASELTKDRPNATLFSVSNLSYVIVMVILQAVGQMSVILALSGVFAEENNYFEKGSL